ncbi:MAG: HlyD family efflux transporter periplasmic adaptor subunit [Gammaproteobacteria bacterium]|nr:HlyD family efflux transporter periplasmic adaptor subunit [Gammaproteobacteria bacterium]NIR83432.1 HlyD family efflux transporter periplasmic adaptor subunit [Gammaproteobacteria bacterium]NIR91354.1 HlyD family efflux transporter periplasmic adaptor subunit [Gammaproteobacteria bacterium]NIU04594.1 HlyD family efflux transporter periplasmic adaptor subunit [Gammaproteobacteria bacterium]NIV51636.1 HlyD family efflux transporter periplasmic adaptor subunit [Gammaproteobacteria bacterium]
MKRLCGFLVAGAGLLLGGCDLSWEAWWPWAESEHEGTIELSGIVEAREVDLAFQVTGRIQTLYVDEGETASAEQVVAVLDPRDYEFALARAQAEAEAAKANLAALEAGTRSQEIQAARATLEKAKAERAFARAEVRRVDTLVERQLAPRDQLDSLQRQLDVARAGVKEAEQRLALLVEGPRKEDIERARAEYEARRAAVLVARQNLDYTILRSRADGVISVRLAEEGEVAQAGQPVLRLARLTQPWVRAYLPETALARVRLGQAARVRVDGLPDRVFEARLSFISPEAEFTPKTVETRELRVDLVYRIKADVDNPDGLLKIGMPADVILETVAP